MPKANAGRRAAAPVTELAARLEHVRVLRGVPTLKEFWERLREAGGSWSYAAVRNYHLGVGKHKGKRVNRDAPLDYVQLVSLVFGVSLEWLAGGGGAVTVEEREAVEKTENADAYFLNLLEQSNPYDQEMPLAVRQVFADVLVRLYSLQKSRAWEAEGGDTVLVEILATELSRALFWPLYTFDLMDKIPFERFTEYALATLLSYRIAFEAVRAGGMANMKPRAPRPVVEEAED